MTSDITKRAIPRLKATERSPFEVSTTIPVVIVLVR